jgi:Cdc6-like AAA superfamily ATPase
MAISEYALRKNPLNVSKNFLKALENSITWYRAEKIPSNLYYPLFVGHDLIRKMRHNSNNVIWGRRGTGKTHLLKAFCQYINEDSTQKDLSLFISICDSRKSESPIINPNNFSNDKLEQSYFARESFKIFVLQLVELLDKQMQLYVNQKLHELSKRDKNHIIARAREKTTELYCSIGLGKPHITEIIDVESNNCKRSKNHNTGISLSLKSIISAIKNEVPADNFIHFIRNREISDVVNKEHKKKIEYTVNEIDIHDIRRRFLEIVDILRIETLYICIDEFSALDENSTVHIQPLFLEYLKSFCFKTESISVKIASIWDNTRLSNRDANHGFLGVEYGQDIVPLFDLDNEYFFADKNNLYSSFANMIAYRVTKYDKTFEGGMHKAHDEIVEKIIETIFLNKNHFECLVNVSHGIPRLVFRILSGCLRRVKLNIQDYYIHRNFIYDEAINIFINEKRQLVSVNNSSDTVYKRINQYIEKMSTNFFLINNNEVERIYEIIDLLSKELIHRMPSSIMPRSIMDDYKGYYIDSGNYLHYIKSKDVSFDQIMSLSTYDLPKDLETSFNDYVIDFDMIDNNIITCNNCTYTFNKRHPVFEKYDICPTCAYKFNI